MREPALRFGTLWLATSLFAAADPPARAQGTPTANDVGRARALATEGLKLLETGQPALAEAKLEGALRLDPSRADAHYGLGKVLLRP